ncbi:MAG: CcdB family protein [Pseudomonadota bacterium]
MAQFCVYALPGGNYVLDLQSDLVDTPTRVAAPLVPRRADLPRFTQLEPEFEIDGLQYALHAGEMAAIPAHFVQGSPLADLRAEDYRIRRALDFLFSGF